VIVEDLNLKGMTKSASGTMEEPGSNVRAKSGLNRSILEEGLGELVNMVRRNVFCDELLKGVLL
jgi:putative transposase